MRFLAAAPRGRESELGFVVCSLDVDVKQVFANVSPINLILVLKGTNIVPKFVGAILRE